MEKEIKLGNVEFIKINNDWAVYQKIYQIEEKPRSEKFTSWLDDVGTTANGTKELKLLFGEKVFNYPKPTSLIKRLMRMANVKDNDIVLDFFAGSGTTGHAVLSLNKEDGKNIKFILCEQMEYINTVTVPRIKKVLEDEDFVYMETVKLNERYIEKILGAKSQDELSEIWKDMKKNSFLSYRIDPKDIDDHAKEFGELSLEDQKKFLIELLDKNDLYVNYSEIEDRHYGVSKEDIRLNKIFYGRD